MTHGHIPPFPKSTRLVAGVLSGLLLLILGMPTPALAEMALLFREMFATTGTLTSASPGQAFTRVSGTLHQRAGGPRLEDGTAASADPQAQDSSGFGIYDLKDPSSLSRVFVGGWFCFKSIQQHEASLLVLIDQYDNPGPQITVQGGRIYGGVAYKEKTVCPEAPVQGWIYLAVASVKEEAGRVSLRFYYKLPGQPMQSWGELNNIYVTREQTTGFLAGFAGNGPAMSLRIGAVAGYSFEQQNFSDIKYPAEVLEPAFRSRHVWYCNPASGNDGNDGTAPERAWKSVSKINEESRHAGLFASDSYDTGDTLVIDTSGAPLDLGGELLEFMTPGLAVQAADGQEWIHIQSHRILLSEGWNPTGVPNVYMTEDTQPHIVMWEDDRFLHHPSGTSFAEVQAALSSTPGSFWTDGEHLYLHPFDSTDPRVDGKVYDRSRYYSQGSPVTLAAPHLLIQDIHVGKTCLAEKSSQDAIGGYCIGNKGSAGRTKIRHCFLYYGSKHNLGLTEGIAGDLIEVENVQVEQGSPYPTYGGQTVLVSFSAGGSNLGIRHVYRRCVSRANTGLIGSAEGEMSSRFPVFYSHNLGGEDQFEAIELVDCDFGAGNISGGAARELKITGCTVGSVLFESDVTVKNSRVNGPMWCRSGHRLTLRNCLFSLNGMLRENPFAGILDVQFCTLDASGLNSYQTGVPQSAVFTRTGPIQVIFKNNLVLMPVENVYANLFSQLKAVDTLSFSHNAYRLGGNRLVYLYDDGISPANQGLPEWQMTGQDGGSFEINDPKLTNHVPQPGSPVIGAAVKTDNREDLTGRYFVLRDNIGAVQTLPASFEDWRVRQFTPEQLANENTQGPMSFANDGISNLAKYALGLDPHGPARCNVFSVTPGPGDGAVWWRYERLAGVADVHYAMEATSNFSSWSLVQPLAEQVGILESGREEVLLLLERGETPRRFFRLKVDQKQD